MLTPVLVDTARQNAGSLGLSARVRFVASDYFSAITGTFDVIVSNPPYVRTTDIESLAREVRVHEPRRALEGGADGLTAYRMLCTQVRNHLVPGGALIVEVGYDQAEDVALLMTTASLSVIRPFRCDLAGVARVVEGRN